MFNLSRTKNPIRISLVAASLLAASSALTQPADKQPVKIGVTLPLSGPLAVNGRNYQNAINLAVKKVNADGGILKGTPVEVVIYDDKGVVEEGVSTVKKLISRDKVDALVTGAISSPALAQKEVSREARMIHVIITAQHKDITLQGHPYLFRLNTTVEMGSAALLKYVVGSLKPKTIWFLGVNDDYGRSVAQAYKSMFDKAGIKMLGTEFYNKDDTDFLVYLIKGKATQPDLVMLAAPSDAIAATILRQKKQIGFNTPVAQAAGVLTKTLVNLAGDAADGVYSADSWVRTLDNPQNKWFIENYEKEFSLPAGKQEAVAYESILFLTQAIDKAGTAKDSDKIASVFRDTTFFGPRGAISFDQIGQALATDYPIVVQNKELVLAH